MEKPFASNDPALAEPGLRTFNQVAKAWSLTASEQSALLGQPIDVTALLAQPGSVEGVGPEMLERISYVLGIYRALHTLFPNRAQADGWIRRPNKANAFEGASALSLMCSGRLEDMAQVRSFLEAGGQVDT